MHDDRSSERLKQAGLVEQVYTFGPFHLNRARRLLLCNLAPVTIGGRAFDILTLLLSRAGDVVTKAELTDYVWPDTFVHEGNLKVNMATLRRALGDGDPGSVYIMTIPGRGYAFVAPVEQRRPPPEPPPSHARGVKQSLPDPTPLFGRADEIAQVSELLEQPGYLAIVGPGGVGKTSLAVAVAHQLEGRHPEGTCFVDLSTIDDPRFVITALASAIGVSPGTDDPMSGVIDAVRDLRRLLILDNCEHVAQTVAVAIERLVTALPGLPVLVTSREPLRTRHERVFHLPALAVPPAGQGATAAEALRFSSVELFVAGAQAAGGYSFVDSDAESVVAICRRLDGLALAIELAAGKAATFDIPTIRTILEQRFELLGYGRRDAPLRHQTLQATMDWSYRLLPDDEAMLFASLAVFSGRFTPEDATAICGGRLDPASAQDALGRLVAKSLVWADHQNGMVQYRLPAATRAYARERLTGDPGHLDILRQHALRTLAIFQRAEAEWSTRPPRPWMDQYASRIDDLRTAVDWAFGSNGSARIGIDLVVAALPLWQELSAFGEMRTAIDLALSAHRALPDPGESAGVKLAAARAWALTLARRLTPETGLAWIESIRAAAAAGDAEYESRALWGHAVYLAYVGRPREALVCLERFRHLTGQDWSAAPDGERLLAHIEVYAGRLRIATRRLEALASRWGGLEDRPGLSRFQMDLPVAIGMSLSFLLWLRGDPERAGEIASRTVARAEAVDHLVSHGNAIALGALPVAFLTGDLGKAAELQRRLEEDSGREGIAIWPGVSCFFAGAIQVAQGRGDGLAAMREGVAELSEGGWVTRTALYHCLIADALIEAGDLDQARLALSTARSGRNLREERWCHPEIFRIAGLIDAGMQKPLEAERWLNRSLQAARTMGALSLELRAANAMADLWRSSGRADEALALLQTTLQKFERPFPSADAKAATARLDALRP